jgi:hypothetical protein
VSAAALLTELEAAGVRLSLAGDDLRYQTEAGVSIAPYRARIRESKPALLAELLAREELAAMGLDPSLRWVHVATAPVEATVPSSGWAGQFPAGCAVPNVCCALGPCPHHAAHGRCWKVEGAR